MTTILSQIDTEKTLTALFASRARVAILRIFMLDPMRAYYQRQLEQATGLAIRAIQRELERLVGIGLLYRHVEGNRTYHQVDMDFPLFPELRSIIVKTSGGVDVLRSRLAMDPAVRLAILDETESRLLVVSKTGLSVTVTVPEPIRMELISSETFVQWVAEKKDSLRPYLVEGIDILGRRNDVIWRRIEASGYRVTKGEGIP